MESGAKITPKCFQKSIKKQTVFTSNKNTKNEIHQGIQGGSNEPAFRSQIPLWDPLGTPGGARAPPKGPLDDCWPIIY